MTKTILLKIFPASGSIRRRIFFLLGGMSLGALLVANLVWLPSAIEEIRQGQGELRRVSLQLVRDLTQGDLEEKEVELKGAAQHFRSSLAEGDREGLRLTAKLLLQKNSAFEEIGLLDEKGKELIRVSRRIVITDRDLIDRSASPLFREGMKQEILWGPVTITETSEPWVTLTVRIPGSDPFPGGLVFGVINLKWLWNLTREFKLSHESRVYIIEERGRLIAAPDPSVVLRQLSFADRPLIRRLMGPRSSDDRSFVEGDYTNEKGVHVVATGLLFKRPRWGIVIEQPQSVLFTPIRHKIWLFAGLSLVGLLLSFGLARTLSHRLTRPLVRLQKGAEQIGGGNLEYRVSAETNDEIGDLARQFNRMAEQLRASQQATLSALTIPVMSQLSEMKGVLDEVAAKVMAVTEAEAASIRIMDDENREFVFSVFHGFSTAYVEERPKTVRDEAGMEKILQTPGPLPSVDILTDSGGSGNPLVREGFRSVVYIPLNTPEMTFGLMTLASREPGRLSSRKADIFRAIAHQISIALQNAKLLAARKQAGEALRESEREARHLARENAVLAEIGRIISSTLNIEEVYELFARETRKLIPLDRIAITIINLDKNTGILTYIAGGEIPDRRTGIPFPMQGTAIAEMVRTGTSVLIQSEDFKEVKDRYPMLSSTFQAGFRSIMNVPLYAKGQIIGGLHLRSLQPNIYTAKDVKLAERVGAQIAGAIANAQLFTERERLEERLRRAEKMEALGTLAGGVAHDLNNVLGVLVGYSELLLMEIREESPLRRHVSNILLSGQRAAAIIQDLLTLARRGVAVSEVVNLNDVISDYFKTPEFEKLKAYHPLVMFRIEFGQDLMNIKGSPIHLSKTIMNLLSNAVEAISDHGEVTLLTENRYLDKPIAGYDEIREGDYVVVGVSDNGKGISAQDMGKIFEPFYTKKVMGRSGTGLGLAVVWGTVKDHGGYIDVRSEEGKGSTFTLYFPVTRGERAKNQPTIAPESYQGRGESILVVDDVKEQRELAAAMLGRLGYRVNVVPSGEEAVVYLRTNRVDLLVLDMIMEPGMDGLETYQRVVEINPKQRAIIVSGYSETERVKAAQELGAGAYVRKPYILEKMGLAIRRELDR